MSARSIVGMLVVLAASDCAHASAPSTPEPAAEKSVYVQPRIAQQQGVLRIRTRSSRPFRGTVEVPIDENGRADTFRIRIMPSMDDLLRSSIIDWLQGVEFIPARRDGVPVAGVFKMKFS